MTDFCYSAPMMQRVLRQAEQMDQMLQCLGAEPVRLVRVDEGMVWYEARTRCIACIHDERCRGWIAERLDQTSSKPPAFCPNAELFRFASTVEVSHEPDIQSMGRALAPCYAQPQDVEGA
jgi:hypothetical protein